MQVDLDFWLRTKCIYRGKLSQVNNASNQKLRNLLPYYCNIFNPIDILEEAETERFRKVMQVCLNDQTNDSVLVKYILLKVYASART